MTAVCAWILALIYVQRTIGFCVTSVGAIASEIVYTVVTFPVVFARYVAFSIRRAVVDINFAIEPGVATCTIALRCLIIQNNMLLELQVGMFCLKLYSYTERRQKI